MIMMIMMIMTMVLVVHKDLSKKRHVGNSIGPVRFLFINENGSIRTNGGTRSLQWELGGRQ